MRTPGGHIPGQDTHPHAHTTHTNTHTAPVSVFSQGCLETSAAGSHLSTAHPTLVQDGPRCSPRSLILTSVPTHQSPCSAKLMSPRCFALTYEMEATKALAFPFQWEGTNLPHHSLSFQSWRALEAGRIMCLLCLMLSGSSGKRVSPTGSLGLLYVMVTTSAVFTRHFQHRDSELQDEN